MPLLLISNSDKFLMMFSHAVLFPGDVGDPQFQHSVMILLISYHTEAVSKMRSADLLAFRQLMTTDDARATTSSKS